MTFSIAARCPRTGAFGAAITTSSLAVGSRCIRLAHGHGVFLSQHRTDPRLAAEGIAQLIQGASAEEAVARVAAGTPERGWRQLGALDRHGTSAAFHGEKLYSIYDHSSSVDCLALGNILATPAVTGAMVAAFEGTDGVLAERLLRALEAGVEAGGEILGPLRSAALVVSAEADIDLCNLRIDQSDAAVAALRRLWEDYRGQDQSFLRLALEPDTVPVNRQLFESSIRRIRELGLEGRFPTEQHREDWWVGD